MAVFACLTRKKMYSKSRSLFDFVVGSRNKILRSLLLCSLLLVLAGDHLPVAFFLYANIVSNHCNTIMKRKNSNENGADCHLLHSFSRKTEHHAIWIMKILRYS